MMLLNIDLITIIIVKVIIIIIIIVQAQTAIPTLHTHFFRLPSQQAHT
jgi:hypothetical protein